MLSKAEARQIVTELVHKYGSEKNTFEDPDYNEARTRQDFINPLFKLLGWDMDNEKRLSQSFREVLYEDKVSIDGNIKHPDYSFRIGNSVLFYVEAKKPSVNIKDNKEAALQLRYYGWNTGLTLSILTNFREFAVYDCRVKPDRKDQAHVARLTYFTYKDLLESQTKFSGGFQDGFDFLANVFVQENIIRGSFDKFIQDDGDRFKKGVVAIDQSFLQTLEDWRLDLAKSIKRTNQDVTENDLNYVVSAILNRIVFLRFAEGRNIEPFGNVRKTIQTSAYGECYKELFTLFERADEKYNSGLFDLGKDNVREQLFVDNSILKKIIGNLYYPSPYAFDIIPVEILGSVYERFLGSVVRLTPGHHVKVEPKPEVRKAGGVFYTPQYIVDYIVEHTIGELVKDKTPADVTKIKVVDPSCGSGSFLLGAYQYLLDWHKNYYAAKYEKEGKTSKGLKNDTLTPFGELATTVKKQILLNNIFGVDIDENAVEITKLSLLLKCLEGETTASIENTRLIFHEKVLPNIDGNIVPGNALIDTDFYNYEFGESVERLVKPFNWQRAFPQVFKQGGFDAVIGNPPYVKKEHFAEHTLTALQTLWGYAADLYVHFIFKDYELAKPGGLLSLIVNDGFLGFKGTSKIRELFFDNDLRQIATCPAETFPQATIYTAVFVLCKQPSPNKMYDTNQFIFHSERKDKTIVREFKRVNFGKVPYALSQHLTHRRLIIGNDFVPVFSKFVNFGKLNDVCTVLDTGIHTGNCRNKLLFKTKERSGLKKMLQGKQISRYCFDWNSANAKYKWCDIHYEPMDTFGIGRGGKKSKQKEYWHWCGDIDNHLAEEKILLRQTDDDLIACYVNKANDGLFYTDNTLHTVLPKENISPKFVLGLLNSKLLNRIYHFLSQEQGKSMAQVKTQVVESIPLPAIDLSQKSGKDMHDKIVRSVNELLELYSRAPSTTLAERKRFEGKIAHFENEIDQTVYLLYGLTAEEIVIVAEAYKPH